MSLDQNLLKKFEKNIYNNVDLSKFSWYDITKNYLKLYTCH